MPTRRRPSEGETEMVNRGLALLREIYEEPDSRNVYTTIGRVAGKILRVLDGKGSNGLYRLMETAGYKPEEAEAVLATLHSLAGLRAFEEYLGKTELEELRKYILALFPTPVSQQGALEYLQADDNGRTLFKHKGYRLTHEQLDYLGNLLQAGVLQKAIDILYELLDDN